MALVATNRRLINGLSAVILVVLAAGLIISLFLKEQWLWLDEVISYVFLSDASLAHVNRAVVGGLDVNPPLFMDVYWLIGHAISLKPLFLRSVSIGFFALTVVLFFRYTTRLLGRPVANFVVVTLFVCLTYLNYTLSTQVRGYPLFLLLSWLFFVNSHHLAAAPGRPRRLAGHLLLGTALAFTHNFGLLYVAVMGAFFVFLAVWSGRWEYLRVVGVQAAAGVIWLVGWFPKFQVQSLAGKPHSWIVLPTFGSFFRTVGELLPTLSAHVESSRYFQFLPFLRVVALAGLIAYLGVPRLRWGYAALVQDQAALFFVQASFVAVGATVLALVASFTVTSVFISRYLWFNHLLFAFMAVYAYHHFFQAGEVPARRFLVAAYAAGLLPFIAYQNRKVVLFPSRILAYLPALNPRYPLFLESADYFLPIWFQHLYPHPYFLLDWPAALRSPVLSATGDYHNMVTLQAQYHTPQVVTLARFNGANFPRFYVVDERSHYQIEEFIAAGRVRVVRVLPTDIEGHRILECTFTDAAPAALGAR